MDSAQTRLLRIFITGLLAALPVAATLAICWWAVNLLNNWVGPDSAVGRVLSAIGLGVTGSSIAGYTIGLALVAGAIFGLGLLVETNLQRGLVRIVNAVLTRIPLVRGVYELTRKMVSLFEGGESEGMKSMSAVWCRFGDASASEASPRALVLGLLSTPEPVLIQGQPYMGVIVPTAPVPVGGGLLFLPQAWVTPADLGIDAVTSIYVSMGMTAGQHLAPPGMPGPAAAGPVSP